MPVNVFVVLFGPIFVFLATAACAALMTAIGDYQRKKQLQKNPLLQEILKYAQNGSGHAVINIFPEHIVVGENLWLFGQFGYPSLTLKDTELVGKWFRKALSMHGANYYGNRIKKSYQAGYVHTVYHGRPYYKNSWIGYVVYPTNPQAHMLQW